MLMITVAGNKKNIIDYCFIGYSYPSFLRENTFSCGHCCGLVQLHNLRRAKIFFYQESSMTLNIRDWMFFLICGISGWENRETNAEKKKKGHGGI